MKRSFELVFLALVTLLPVSVFAQLKATAQNVPEIRYTSVPNFLKLPAGEYLGESVGVATNSKGHIFVYHRSANTRLWEFDKNGNFVKEIGKGYYGFEFAHSVRVDAQDNIWTVDEGTNTVTKFSPEGKFLMVLGRRPPAVDGAVATTNGPNPPAQKYIFCRPTDVGMGSAGQHLRFRRLLQQPRREVRQERPVPGAGRQREAPATARDSSICRTVFRSTDRATSGSPTAPTTATRFSTTI